MAAATQDSLGAFIFVGCAGSPNTVRLKDEPCSALTLPLLTHPYGSDVSTTLKRIYAWVVSCEILCAMRSACK
jgi:hypothetical protein